jgi:hypothetical protein
MVSGVIKLAGDWKYDRVSIGYPGLIQKGRIMRELHNLAPNWIGFNFEDVVIGGGNVKNLKELPTGCRAGDNAYAFIGGFRLWEENRNQGSPKKTK